MPFADMGEYRKYREEQRLKQQQPKIGFGDLFTGKGRTGVILASFAMLCLWAMWAVENRELHSHDDETSAVAAVSLLPSQRRAQWNAAAKTLEEALLREGIDARVSVIEDAYPKTSAYLNIAWGGMSRVYTREFMNRTEVVDAIRRAGFSEISFRDTVETGLRFRELWDLSPKPKIDYVNSWYH